MKLLSLSVRHTVAGLVTLCAGMLGTVCQSFASSTAESSLPLYQEGYATGISDWSWTETNPLATTNVSDGRYALYGQMGSFEGIYLGFEEPVSVSANGSLEFSIYSERATEIVVHTSASGVGDGNPIVITLPGGQWLSQRLPLSDLGVQEIFSGV